MQPPSGHSEQERASVVSMVRLVWARVGVALAFWFVTCAAWAQVQAARPQSSSPPGSVANQPPGGPSASVSAPRSTLAPPSSASGAAASGSAAAPPSSAEVVSPRLEAMRTLAQHLQAFKQGSLGLQIDPASLFDIPLDDEVAVALERRRLEALLEPMTAPAASASGHARAVPPKPSASTSNVPLASAAPSASGAPSATGEPEVDPELWRARVAVDTARLAVLQMPRGARLELLEAHEKRQQEQIGSKQAAAVNDAHERARSADRERQEALEAARRTRSEAARLVVEERARLLGVKKRQAEYEAELLKQDALLSKGQEGLLKTGRRVREVVDGVSSGTTGAAAADGVFDNICTSLAAVRAEFGSYVVPYIARTSSVPEPGGDPLGSVPPEIDTSEADTIRKEVETQAAALRQSELMLRERRVRLFWEEMRVLNKLRLELLPLLSRPHYQKVTSLSTLGFDEAWGELRQVALVLQYHFGQAVNWFAEVQRAGKSRDNAAMVLSVWLLKWLGVVLLFGWWRRHSVRVLERAIQDQADARAHSAKPPSRWETALRYLSRVHSPLEWMLLIWAMLTVLPAALVDLQEAALLWIVAQWILGGRIAVQTLDFLAARRGRAPLRRQALDTSAIRWKSLRAAGWVVVTLGLVLSLSNLLVGPGIIYSWVLRFCWVAGLLLAFVTLRWWRPIIVRRVARRQSKSRLGAWVVGHAHGLWGFVATLLGAVLLLNQSLVRFVKGWISGFEVSRRVLAYLFRREIVKKAEDAARLPHRPLDPVLRERLVAMRNSIQTVPGVADAELGEVIRRIDAPGGGVFAIVGERGGGKSTLLSRIAAEAAAVRLLECPFGGMRTFAPVLLKGMGSDAGARLEIAAAEFDEAMDNGGLLIDDAHRLIRPTMGGMKDFDRVIELARRYSKNAAWVFAFDAVIWQFFERMRGARPLFDSVVRLTRWTDEGIARLLTTRNQAAGLQVDFTPLMGELPADADEVDLKEALQRTELNYYRLVWDYADGNPGVALRVWAESLEVGPNDRIYARVFQPPDPKVFEGLPDSARFVLRAIVQLERARPETVSQATGIALAEVDDALRYGSVRGYFEENDQGFAVTGRWFRAITRYLARHHLLPPLA